MARRELVGYLEAGFLGPTDHLDFDFLRILSIKLNRPRVTGPLALSGLGSGFGFFSGFFCLVMHTNQILISTQNNQQICRKAGRGAGLLHAPYAGSYLLFLKPNSLLAGTHTTLFSKRNKWLHSPRQRRQNVE